MAGKKTTEDPDLLIQLWVCDTAKRKELRDGSWSYVAGFGWLDPLRSSMVSPIG